MSFCWYVSQSVLGVCEKVTFTRGQEYQKVTKTHQTPTYLPTFLPTYLPTYLCDKSDSSDSSDKIDGMLVGRS